MKKTYTTAQGKTVSMDSIRLANEEVIAVGNMKVNARGDLIDDKGNVISTKPAQVNAQYNKEINNNQG